MYTGGMKVDTTDDATYVSAITFNTKMTKLESRMNKTN